MLGGSLGLRLMLAGQLEQEQVSVVARLLTPALPPDNACW